METATQTAPTRPAAEVSTVSMGSQGSRSTFETASVVGKGDSGALACPDLDTSGGSMERQSTPRIGVAPGAGLPV